MTRAFSISIRVLTLVHMEEKKKTIKIKDSKKKIPHQTHSSSKMRGKIITFLFNKEIKSKKTDNRFA